MFKMLFVVMEKGELLVVVVLVIGSFDLKVLVYVVGVKKVDMVDL